MEAFALTRQPIFDLHGHVAGYDVRFRPSSTGGDPLAEWLFTGSVAPLGRGRPVWVEVSEALIMRDAIVAPGDATLVALIPSAIEVTDGLLDKVDSLRAAGVPVALDEFQAPTGSADPLHELMRRASFVRVGADAASAEALVTACEAARCAGLTIAADQVGDERELAASTAAGAELFQGAHFAHPQPLPRSALPAATVNALHVLSLARNDNTPERDLERAISADPTLTFQLLRVVNSASMGGRGIVSVPHALRLTGRATLVRWLALAVLASRARHSAVDRELSDQAVRRAYMASFLAERCTAGDPQSAFLTGMFSMLDAVFRVPLADVLDMINVANGVRDALLDRSGQLGRIVDYMELFEMAQWESAGAVAAELGVPPGEAERAYGYADAEVAALLSGV